MTRQEKVQRIREIKALNPELSAQEVANKAIETFPKPPKVDKPPKKLIRFNPLMKRNR